MHWLLASPSTSRRGRRHGSIPLGARATASTHPKQRGFPKGGIWSTQIASPPGIGLDFIWDGYIDVIS